MFGLAGHIVTFSFWDGTWETLASERKRLPSTEHNGQNRVRVARKLATTMAAHIAQP